MNDVTQQNSGVGFTTQRGMSLAPQNITEAMAFADYLAKSDMVPKDFIGKAGNILVAIQWGMELGLQPMQAMQNIAVINGRPSLWGDAVLAIVIASPVCEDVQEFYEGTPGNDDYTAVCISKRKGKSDKIGKFSIADAKKASLWDKAGPWKNYPNRMLQMRARGFSVRDQFPDVLKGMPITEELMDYEPEKIVNPSPNQTYQVAERKPQAAAINHEPVDSKPAPTHVDNAAEYTNQQGSASQTTGTTDPADRVKPNHLKVLRGKLEGSGKDEISLCQQFKIGSLEELPLSVINNALDWIAGK